MSLCIGFFVCRLTTEWPSDWDMILRWYERDNAAENAGAGTTFGWNGKKKTVVHSYSEHRIVTPTIQIRTLKGCGLNSGRAALWPCQKIKHRNGDDIFEQGKQQKSAYQNTLIRRRKWKTKTLFGSVRTNAIRFIRQLCKGRKPKAKPPREFWELLNTLYSVHNGFKECAKYESAAMEICKEIECLILDLQEAG